MKIEGTTSAPDQTSFGVGETAKNTSSSVGSSQNASPPNFGDAAQLEIKNLKFKKPIGESGGEIRAATRANSLVQVFAFEISHKAAQRRQAQQQGADVNSQKTTIKVTVDDSGHLVALGGETTTSIEGSGGEQAEINELALLSDFSNGNKSASAAFFGDSRRALPQFFIFDSFLSRLNIESSRLALKRNSGLLTGSIKEHLQGRELSLKFIDKLQGNLENLEGRVNSFSSLSPFNNKSANGNLSGVFSAEALSSNTPAGSFQVEVKSIARSKEVAFDAVSKDNVALGVSGEFELNGVVVNVKASDTLIDLKNLINFGEDFNGNSHLDNVEDVNGNGVLDPGEDTNDNGFLDTDEDVNGNGILDPGEDLNYNGALDLSEDRDFDRELDLGTEDHGIKAFKIDNVLILKSTETNGPIEVNDTDGILEELGLIQDPEFFKHDEFNKKEFKNIVFEGSQAVIEVDGEEFQSSTNIIENAIEGVRLTINSHRQEQITLDIGTDVQELFNSFDLVVSAFNSLQSEVNELLKPKGLFRDNDKIQRVKTESLNAFRFERAPPFDELSGLEELGVTQERARVTLDELSISQAVSRINRGAPSIFDRAFGVPTTVNSINNFALTGNEDGQLSVDSAKLSQALEEDVETADSELGFGDGFSDRLDEILGNALGSGGHLFFARAGLENTQSASEILEDLLKSSPRRSLAGLQVNLLA